MTGQHKRSSGDLTILGGSPAFAKALHVGSPNVGDRDSLIRRIDDLLERRWLTNDGRYVREFEEAVASIAGTSHCVAVANGTLALAIAARASRLLGEVILPAFTFVATAHALEWVGIEPVIVDIDPDTFSLDPDAVQAAITERTTGIIGVHVFGRPCRVEELAAIADRHGLTLLFDAAHAFGCTHNGRAVGGFGTAETFSFHATKVMNTFEGGAIVTNDDDVAARARTLRNFGFSENGEVVGEGINAKMNEVSAAMGLTSLDSLADFIEANRTNYEAYVSELGSIPGIRLVEYDKREKRNYHYVVALVDPDEFGLTASQTAEILRAENVLARRYFAPGLHRVEPYRSSSRIRGTLPITDHVAARTLVLPTGTATTPATVSILGSILKVAQANAGKLTQVLGGVAWN